MHLPSLSLSLVTLLGTATADSMASYRECAYAGSACHSHRAVWFSSYDAQDINADSGCRTGASGMKEFCVDWSMWPPRGHFYYHGQGKRCFRHTKRIDLGYSDVDDFTGRHNQLDYWDEVGCSW
ncbi:hypothetical protein QBC34DRAFT_383578 [Podospora aff. communis PSN243]|uniref:Secreted protein n=1 Tax=Podospora aff. communis PSN243 TaxID=3040156 RepID=A0AAV9GE51_9PEZI|nr:hypothetical protein QBC34DRAFT_383578 [Podospora aff. communis PSN243]